MKIRASKAERLADEELMPLIGEKDADAFEVFYDRHGGVAYSLAYRIVGERAAAEDVTQEAFISIWRSGARYDRGARQRALLDAGHRPQPGDRLPAQQAGAGAEARLRRRRGARAAAGSRSSTDAEALRRETAHEVRGALGELPGEQSKVIELAYFGGFSHSEIATMLGVPLGTVKGRMRLGLEKIRGRAGGGTGMNETEHEQLARRARRLPAGGAGARRGGRAGAATSPAARSAASELAVAAPGGAGAARVGGAGRAAAGAARAADGAGALPRPRAATARAAARGAARTSALGALRPLAGLAAVALIVGRRSPATRSATAARAAAQTTTVVAGHSPGVTAEMVREGETGTLRLANLHQLPSDKVLQAWVQRGKRVESAKALFVPNRDGTATATIDDMNGVNTVMVTAEPRGGSVQPTSTPIVAVAIPQ